MNNEEFSYHNMLFRPVDGECAERILSDKRLDAGRPTFRDADAQHIARLLPPHMAYQWIQCAEHAKKNHVGGEDDVILLTWLHHVYFPIICLAPLSVVLEWVCDAVRDGDEDLLCWLVETCTTRGTCDDARWTPEQVLTSLCVEDPLNPDHYSTPLHLAATLGYIYLLRVLLEEGYLSCIRHVADSRGYNLAQTVVQTGGHLDMLRYLLEKQQFCRCPLGREWLGADSGDSLMNIAVDAMHWSLVQYLIHMDLILTSEWTTCPRDDNEYGDFWEDGISKPSVFACVRFYRDDTRADEIKSMHQIWNLAELGCVVDDDTVFWMCEAMGRSQMGLSEALSRCPSMVDIVTPKVYGWMTKPLQEAYIHARKNIHDVVQLTCHEVMAKRPTFHRAIVDLIASYLDPMHTDQCLAPLKRR
jgi:hypothetical protein